ncbi:MAG TPA: DUF4145 domain-containing protein [Gammaproteobacteria bacterium]|nr:DUF4145 domain-containing protein [Gammaproteobacteria bacterium]
MKFKVTSWGNPIHFEAQPIEIERARVAYELKYLPEEVKNDFSEALICYSQGCWNAFAAMCRRALQSAAMALGADGTTKITRQLDNLREMQVVSEEEFEQLKTIMITGHDGAHPHLPNINGDRAAVLLELMKDALTQLFVRKAKIEEASKLRAQATKQK